MPDALTFKGPKTSATAAAAAAAAMAAAVTSSPAPQNGGPLTVGRLPVGTREPDKQSLNYIIRSGVAGGVAGCAAKTLVAPLDRVKILFQASNPKFIKYTGSWLGVANAVTDIRRSDGLAGLFRGHSATLLRIFPYAAVKFVAYEQFRAVLIRTPEQEIPLRRFLSGSLAGVTSVFCTYPLELIRVRLAFETGRDYHSSLRSICHNIYREPHTSYPLLGGFSNFYRGFSPTVLGMLPYAGMSFFMHDLVGDWFRSPSMAEYTIKDADVGEKRKPVLKAWAQLAAGGIAGMTSQTASYPLEVIRRRMQVGGARGEVRFPTIKETAAQIWRQNGLRGFFVGLTIGYVKIVPMVATSFFAYERMKLYLGIA